MLTDMFKNMENLLINMDKAVIQLLEKEDINMMMNDETFANEFKKVEKERNQHKINLIDLSGAFGKLN